MILIYIAWVIRIVLNLFSYAHLWWIKEYRFDRMFIHLRSVSALSIFFPSVRRPPITPKSVFVVLLSSATLIAAFPKFPLIVRFLIGDLLSFPTTWVIVALLHIPTKIYHTILINRATRKLRQHKNLLIVAITGSYGKTSVKDYLTTILSQKYRVLKTQASKNSPIGIAEVVLKSIRSDHQIFVVEMGAYKRGEIAQIAKMVRPHIGIITAINPQHQDLFGSLENTMKAKYELIQGLIGRKLGIFNADDSRVLDMIQWAKRDGVKIWEWSKKNIQDIKSDFSGIQFELHFGDERTYVTAPVLGEHQAGNITASILGSVACGMKLSDAARAAKNIKPAKGVMQKREGINGATFIDDTFNNNPDAAKAAISFLKKAKGNKILVFQPMIELGSYAVSSHREVGRLASSICDEIILTNDGFHKEFPTARVMNVRSAVQYLRTKLQKNDTVLFKGKEAGFVLKNL